jgi:hypothetical protein
MTQRSGSLSAKVSRLVAAITFSTTYPKTSCFMIRLFSSDFACAIDRGYGVVQANDAAVFSAELYGGEEWPKHRRASAVLLSNRLEFNKLLRLQVYCSSTLGNALCLMATMSGWHAFKTRWSTRNSFTMNTRGSLIVLAAGGAPTHEAIDALGLLELYVANAARKRDQKR